MAPTDPLAALQADLDRPADGTSACIETTCGTLAAVCGRCPATDGLARVYLDVVGQKPARLPFKLLRRHALYLLAAANPFDPTPAGTALAA